MTAKRKTNTIIIVLCHNEPNSDVTILPGGQNNNHKQL